METQLYRKLEAGELVEDGDLIWMDAQVWETVSPCYIGDSYSPNDAALRPFKSISSSSNSSPVVGITLRQHYAGLAMQGILSNHNVDPLKFGDKLISELSVFFADALIAALEKKEEASITTT